MSVDKKKVAKENSAKESIKKILDAYSKLSDQDLTKVPQLQKLRPAAIAADDEPYGVCYEVTYAIGSGCDKKRTKM
jgi:hypothetical protein